MVSRLETPLLLVNPAEIGCIQEGAGYTQVEEGYVWMWGWWEAPKAS